MARRAYAILCASFGVLLCILGTFLFAQFFRFHAPGGLGLPLLPMGPNGHYFVARPPGAAHLRAQRRLVALHQGAARGAAAGTRKRKGPAGGLRDGDENSTAIDTLGLRKQNPEAIEDGVPVPATYVLDREGVVRFVDVRKDFHVWVDPAEILGALAKLP